MHDFLFRETSAAMRFGQRTNGGLIAKSSYVLSLSLVRYTRPTGRYVKTNLFERNEIELTTLELYPPFSGKVE